MNRRTFAVVCSLWLSGPALADSMIPNGQPTNPPTIYSGQFSCSGATVSAVALSSQALVNGVVLKASKINTGTIYLGPSGVNAATGYPLAAQEAASYGSTNLSAVFYLCTVATDSIAATGN